MEWWFIFGRIFSVFVLFSHKQRYMGCGCVGVVWGSGWWNSRFSRQFHDWELEGVMDFFQELQACSIRREEDDSLEWKESNCGKFSVKSFYLSLVQGRNEPFLTDCVWNPWVPVKLSEAFFLFSFFGLWKHLGKNFDDRSTQKQVIEYVEQVLCV